MFTIKGIVNKYIVFPPFGLPPKSSIIVFVELTNHLKKKNPVLDFSYNKVIMVYIYIYISNKLKYINTNVSLDLLNNHVNFISKKSLINILPSFMCQCF